MKINIFYKGNEPFPTQMWDYYYVYKQHLAFPTKPELDFTFNDINDNNITINQMEISAINVLHMQFDSIFPDIDECIHMYDLVLIDNHLESISVSSDETKRLVNTYDNVFLIAGSILNLDHVLYDKVITFDLYWEINKENYTSFKLITSHSDGKNNNRNGLVYIGGEMRSYRKYIFDLLENVNIIKKQRYSQVVCTDDVYYDDYTQIFVDKCNELYNVSGIVPPYSPLYKEIYIGIKGRQQGECNVGAILLPEYTMAKCIIYPESSFTNNEFHFTEKTWKCVTSKTHWVMFAGRGSYSIMREYGIRSILELIPNGIQFDDIACHEQRYHEIVKSIHYVNENLHIFDLPEANNILTENYESFYNNNKIIKQMADKIDTTLSAIYDKKTRRTF